MSIHLNRVTTINDIEEEGCNVKHSKLQAAKATGIKKIDLEEEVSKYIQKWNKE